MDKSVESTLPEWTWWVRIVVKSPVGSSNNWAISPSGNNANAASVGAKTVNGPSPFNVSTNPAATTAASSVVWFSEFTTTSTTVVDWLGCTVIELTIPIVAWSPIEQSYVNEPEVLKVIHPKLPPEFGDKYWSTKSCGFP